jgi:hypothetical protein
MEKAQIDGGSEGERYVREYMNKLEMLWRSYFFTSDS